MPRGAPRNREIPLFTDTTMKLIRLGCVMLVGALLPGCVDLTQPNPNERSTDTFWRTPSDLREGMIAAYAGLSLDGTYGRHLNLLYDGRSDIAHGLGANGGLNGVLRFQPLNYNGNGFSSGAWDDHYHAIFRANQVIANAPGIEMDAGERDRIVAEAKFIRALMYFNLVILYRNVPLVLEPLQADARPEQASPEAVWAQIETDLQDARAVLPSVTTYRAGGANLGRATRGAATALLGKAHLQQREWSEAAAALREVIDSNEYSLLQNYGDLFDDQDENHEESVFEVQFVDAATAGTSGARGFDVPRLRGPQGPSFIELQPTPWYFCQFFADPEACLAAPQNAGTTAGTPDPRLDHTIFWNRPGGMIVFGREFLSRYPNAGQTTIYWKKWSQHWLNSHDFESPVNFTVIRLAGVLLMYAEAAVESGDLPAAKAAIDRVRDRVGLDPVPLGTQEEMRAAVEKEQLLELGWELGRWPYLLRHSRLPESEAEKQEFVSRDRDYSGFDFNTYGASHPKSELLPIPLVEVNYNPNVQQNPGY